MHDELVSATLRNPTLGLGMYLDEHNDCAIVAEKIITRRHLLISENWFSRRRQ